MDIQNVLPRDAIPSIDDPSFGTEHVGDTNDTVVVVDGDPARAYLVRILSSHEIVNDVLGSDVGVKAGPSDASTSAERRPIAVTWCPICGSAVVYDRTVDGRVLTFGTSGKLADDALVMYDRETESEWKQPLGRAIGGPLEGAELDVVPARMTSWANFRSEYPDGVVLQPVRGSRDDPERQSPRAVYDMSPYESYATFESFGLREMRGEGRERTWDREDIDAKTVVLGVVSGDEAVRYPIPIIEAEGGVIADSVGNVDVLVVASDASITAFEDPGYDFELRGGRLYADGAA